MGVLADTIDEVGKLPVPARIAVGAGGVGLLLWLYLSHRNAASGAAAAANGLAGGAPGGGFSIVSGAPSTSTSTSTTAGGSTTTTPITPAPKPTPKPVVTPAKPAGYSGPQYYTVKSGDYLSAISSRYAVPGGWQQIFNLNRGVIGSNPNLIRPGQVLRLY